MRISPQKLLIPLLLSFSLTAAAVAWIYYSAKKREDEDELAAPKSSNHVTKTLSIPRQFVPLLIGRGGATIQHLQDSTRTKVSFKEETEVDLLERVCVVTGRREDVDAAEAKIRAILEDQPVVETYEYWVPQRALNRFLERGGEVINEIQRESNAKIIVEDSAQSADPDYKKRVIIKGNVKQIANALVQLEDKVREERESRALAESSSLGRTTRVKTPPSGEDKSSPKSVNTAKEIFGVEVNEGLIEVFVSAVDSPSKFYIQVIGPTNAKLDDLVLEMRMYYDATENQHLHALQNLFAGQIVAAKFTVDDKFYRAEIIDHVGNEFWEVYFVDFGDQAKVERRNIFELRTDFLSLRFQAIECALAGIKPCEGEWSEAATEVFSELSAHGRWEPRVAKIRGYKERALAYGPGRREGSPIPCVELYEKRNDELFNINKQLIALEFGVSEAEPWSAASSTVSLQSTLSRRGGGGGQESRARTPEDTLNGSGKAAPAATAGVQQVDLTATTATTTPEKKPEPAKNTPVSSPNRSSGNNSNVELIDLTTPTKQQNPQQRNGSTPSRSFLESERNSSPYARNGSTTTGYGSNNSRSSSYNKKPLPENPFKRPTAAGGRNTRYDYRNTTNFVPAGYEDEMSDDSDGFEFN